MLCNNKGFHTNTHCTSICDRGQTGSQKSSDKNPAGQWANAVAKIPAGQELTCQINTTINTNVVHGILLNNIRTSL